jgi:hypothetical protein
MAEPRLLLLAHDADAVPTISALVQSAAVRVTDIVYDQRARRVVLLTSRYRWEHDDLTRIRSALRIESVVCVARRRWPADAVLELLALTLGGDALTLTFAGGTTLRVIVECPDLTLEDISAPWPATREPRYD